MERATKPVVLAAWRSHWIVGVGLPVVVTVKVGLAPTATATLTGLETVGAVATPADRMR